MREEERAYFEEKREKNLGIPLMPETVGDQIKA